MFRFHALFSLIGRFALGLVFVVSGYDKAMSWSGTAKMMSSAGLPMVPLLLALTIFVELVAGICVVLGFRTRLAAFVLCLFLLAVTPIFHPFWSLSGSAEAMQQAAFLKNLAIGGGLLILYANGPGRLAISYP